MSSSTAVTRTTNCLPVGSAHRLRHVVRVSSKSPATGPSGPLAVTSTRTPSRTLTAMPCWGLACRKPFLGEMAMRAAESVGFGEGEAEVEGETLPDEASQALAVSVSASAAATTQSRSRGAPTGRHAVSGGRTRARPSGGVPCGESGRVALISRPLRRRGAGAFPDAAPAGCRSRCDGRRRLGPRPSAGGCLPPSRRPRLLTAGNGCVSPGPGRCSVGVVEEVMR